jgi:septal ring factor EnvC (AmiA/AmiB activator)
MLRLRFLPGLIVGLLLGLPLGAIVTALLLPARHVESAATSLEVEQLSRRLERAEQDKQALNRQLDEFRTMADRMTASFTELERRFKTLEEEMQAREAAAPSPTSMPATPTPAPTTAEPESAPTGA